MGSCLGNLRHGERLVAPAEPLQGGARYQEPGPDSQPSSPSLSHTSNQHQCLICDEADVEFPSNPPTDRCTHPINVCASCLEKYVCSCINNGAWRIKCPMSGCFRRHLEVDEVLRTSISEEHKATYEKFCDSMTRRKLGTDPTVAWCKAPGCGSAQIHTEVNCTMVVCHACSARSCFRHDTVWHEGMTCKEFDKELKRRSPKQVKQVQRNTNWLEKNAKICPGEGCGRWVVDRNSVGDVSPLMVQEAM